MAGSIVVSTARFVAEEQGVEKTVAALINMSNAAKRAAVENMGFSRDTKAAIADVERQAAKLNAIAATSMKSLVPKDAAKVIDQSSRQFQQLARQVNGVRAAIDPAHRDMLKFESAAQKVTRAAEAQVITWKQHGEIMGSLRTRYLGVGKAMEGANTNIKLTTGQMQGLGYQINDIGTMLALGASPFQVIASQAGQVIQVLGDGPKGVKGSLAAIGSSIASLATRTNLIVGGLTAAGAAAIYFATRSDSSVKTAEEALKGYKALVDSLEDSYSQAGDAAERYFERAQKEGPNVALAAIQGTTAEIRASLAQEMEKLYPTTQGFVASFATLTPEVLKGQDAIRRLGDQLKSGELTAAQFREQIALLRVNPTTPPDIVKIADKLLASSINARDLANALGAVGEAAATASGKMGRLKVPSVQDMVEPYGGAMDMLKRLKPEAFDGLVDGLRDQADALTETTEKTRTYADAVADQRQGIEDSLASLRLQVDMLGESDGAVAAAKMRMDALAEAQRQATDAGKGAIDPALVSFITQQAEEYGRLTDQVKANTEAQREQEKAASDVRRQQERVAEFASDLQFERSIARLPQAEQRVRETIRGLDVDYDSFEGQRLAAGIRYNDALTETQDRTREMGETAHDVFFDLVDAIGSGESALGSFARAFSGIGKQLASDGFDKLFGGLFGGGAPAGGSANGIAGAISSLAGAAKAAVPTPTARPAYATDVAAVSGSMMKYASRFNSSVDSRLLKVLNTAASRFDMKVEATSGVRPGDSRFHGQGVATDVQIYGANGQALGNYQDPATFRTYERFAQLSKQVQSELFPELEGMLRWGGYFSGGKGKYGAVDNMHFDLAGSKVGMGGGSWENGLNASQRKLWAGAESIGMSKQDFQRVLTKGTSQGVQDGVKATAYDMGGYDSGSPASGMTRGQAGLNLFGAAAGIFGAGVEGGNPLMGGVQGAMGGLGAASSLGALFPSLGAAAGPLGMVGGAALGCIGGKMMTRKEKMERKAA